MKDQNAAALRTPPICQLCSVNPSSESCDLQGPQKQHCHWLKVELGREGPEGNKDPQAWLLITAVQLKHPQAGCLGRGGLLSSAVHQLREDYALGVPAACLGSALRDHLLDSFLQTVKICICNTYVHIYACCTPMHTYINVCMCLFPIIPGWPFVLLCH